MGNPPLLFLSCSVVLSTYSIKKKKREREMPNLCQDWTSLVNQVSFQEERIKGNMLT